MHIANFANVFNLRKQLNWSVLTCTENDSQDI